jgi:transposase
MADKNRYYRRSKITEAKLGQLVRCSTLGFTASSNAELIGLSVISVNTIYLHIQQRLEKSCEKNPSLRSAVEVNEAYFIAHRVEVNVSMTHILKQ